MKLYFATTFRHTSGLASLGETGVTNILFSFADLRGLKPGDTKLERFITTGTFSDKSKYEK